QVDYEYYDGIQPYGNSGDLKRATIKEGSGAVLDTKYYRYYTSPESGIGYAGGLKYVFGPQSYARLVAAVGVPTSATDNEVKAYADDYFQYDPNTHQVTQVTMQGAGCTCSSGNGQGTFVFSYSTRGVTPAANVWNYKTTEVLPDNSASHLSKNIV